MIKTQEEIFKELWEETETQFGNLSYPILKEGKK